MSESDTKRKEADTMKNRAAGRPPKYKCKEEIETKIEEYFVKCEGKILKDASGEPVISKTGIPIYVDQHPPTVTGLALALGFTSRQALLNYQGKKEFVDTITRAKARVEAYTEERLFDRDGSSGAQFSLKNNFSGWNERQEVQVSGVETEKTKLDDLIRQMSSEE